MSVGDGGRYSEEIKSSLTTELNQQVDLVKKLRQQLLQDAVQGKLVEQNPKDEPASELLKKIKVEKEKLSYLLRTAQAEFDLYNQRINNELFLKGLNKEKTKALKEDYDNAKQALLDAKSDIKVFNNRIISFKETQSTI